jgi:hypothetical protein
MDIMIIRGRASGVGAISEVGASETVLNEGLVIQSPRDNIFTLQPFEKIAQL